MHEDRIRRRVYAALYLVYLHPAGQARVRTLSQVVDLMLACPEPVVQALVRKAGHKTLYNSLSKRFVLPEPSRPGLSTRSPAAASDFLKRELYFAYRWAENAGLPIIPLEKAAEVEPLTLSKAFLQPLEVFLQPHERDLYTLWSYITHSGPEHLPPRVQDALDRVKLWVIRRVGRRHRND
jgi:hypothetical protein